MYGIACAALGILSTLPTSLTIDAYGPICDNAGGLAEMCHMPPATRERTDDLDAAGNTTAAIGKGFAIASAALVSLALFGAFVSATQLSIVDILTPWAFAGLLYGAMLPYWFSALTMKSVGKAAFDMVKEVERQLDVNTESGRAIRQNKQTPNYAACIAISTRASLREMIAPGALVIVTPIVAGFLFGPTCLAGLLAGNLVSGVQIAISASNTGGAWDNAKKYLSSIGRKSTDEYRAAVIGDTVGDPLKDTSGPSVNILIKLSAIISVVFAPSLPKAGYFVQLANKILGVN
uniref:H(+)-exporting diphosphatase n=1 Tax=Lygus hesperus TaxID=30085 RepID=A0A0A9VWD8_LYGHE